MEEQRQGGTGHGDAEAGRQEGRPWKKRGSQRHGHGGTEIDTDMEAEKQGGATMETHRQGGTTGVGEGKGRSSGMFWMGPNVVWGGPNGVLGGAKLPKEVDSFHATP